MTVASTCYLFTLPYKARVVSIVLSMTPSPATRSSTKRKLSYLLVQSPKEASSTLNPSRRPKVEPLKGPAASASMSTTASPDSRPEHYSTQVKSENASTSPTMAQIPEVVPMKAENLKKGPRDEPETEQQTEDHQRYHQPKLAAEVDEIVMRKYYPPEMSNARVEMYKNGELPRPIDQIEKSLSETFKARSQIPVKDAVIHWFRGDLRICDNTALHMASTKAKDAGVSLIGLFLVSPEDYEAHIKSPARVDFMLRTLEVLQRDLDKLNIPLWVEIVEHRKHIDTKVLSLTEKWNASHIFGNMEYEVDELRRDARLIKKATAKGIDFTVVHDSVVAPPGVLLTKSSGKPFTVFSPWFKAWVEYLHNNPKYLKVFPPPSVNPPTTREKYAELFGCPVPESVKGKDLHTSELEYVRRLFPAGEGEALTRLERFLNEKIINYNDRRDLPGGNGTSCLSVHFAAGTLSARTAVSKARDKNGNGSLNSGNKGICCWISEIGWRDFYRNVLINFPWVCMAKPFKAEYSNIPWEYNNDHFHAWCTGKTGYPIVDAAMRQLTTMKYMHNRARMIVASFLTKDLCLDWRKGERFFMEHLIDGDFASNNGGWGWSSSSGCDPQPYFRIFNPLLQSEKFDPDGEYIRRWVPELRNVKGKAIHAPFERLDRKEWQKLEKLGYPRPIVKHHEAKGRALAMYKAELGRDKP